MLNIIERRVGLWGHLLLEVYRHGRKEDEIEDHNVITSTGKVQILKAVGSMPGATTISRMSLGDGGCGASPPPSQLYTPIPFASSDTDLRQPIGQTVTNDSSTSVNVGAKTITFIAFFVSTSFSTYHFTPKVVNEIALRSGSSDDVAVALRSFKSIPFDPADSVQVKATWTIGLT